MQILRPLHQLVAGARRVRFWSARWLSPRFVWPEARHESHERLRHPLRRTPPPPDLCGGIVTTDLRRWPQPGFVTGRGDLDDIDDIA